MQRFKGVGTYATVGLDFALAVVIGFLGGRWLDNRLETGGWLTIIGFLFGVAAGFNLLFKAAKRMREDYEREDRQQAAAQEATERKVDEKRSKSWEVDERKTSDGNDDKS